MNRPVIESRAMGQLPVINLSLVLGACGLAQLAGFPASNALDITSGRDVDLLWSFSLVLAFFLIFCSLRVKEPRNERALEIGGIVLMAVGQITFGYAILTLEPAWMLEGKLVVLAYVYSGISATCGRAIFLWRQLKVMERLRRSRAEEGK